MHGNKGFSLVELLLALALLAALASWAMPAMADVLALVRLRSAVQAYIQAVHFARQSALSQGVTVRLCPSLNGSTCTPSPYHSGWIVLQDPLPYSTKTPSFKVLQDQAPWRGLEIRSNQAKNTGLLFLANGTPEPGFFGMSLRFHARTQVHCVILARSARIRYASC